MRTKLTDQLPKPVQADLQRLGQLIRHGRAAKGISQRALAARLQISPTTVLAAERGDPTVASGILAALLWTVGIGPISEGLLPPLAETALKAPTGKRVRTKVLDDF